MSGYMNEKKMCKNGKIYSFFLVKTRWEIQAEKKLFDILKFLENNLFFNINVTNLLKTLKIFIIIKLFSVNRKDSSWKKDTENKAIEIWHLKIPLN